MVDTLIYFLFQPVIHDWCNKVHGMWYPVCGMMHIKEPLMLIRKNHSCSGGNGFPLFHCLSRPLPYIQHHITINKMHMTRRTFNFCYQPAACQGISSPPLPTPHPHPMYSPCEIPPCHAYDSQDFLFLLSTCSSSSGFLPPHTHTHLPPPTLP